MGGQRSQKIHFRMFGGQGIGLGWTGPLEPSNLTLQNLKAFMLLQQFSN